MGEPVKLTIPGRPVPAVRMTQRSKFSNKTAQRYLAYKEQIGWEAKAAGCKEPLIGKIEVSAKAYIKLLSREIDIDNLAKAFLDGLNKIAWYDDQQVVRLIMDKIYVGHASEERAEIEFRLVEG
jgi:Holliday junction resolvase RusA-like endonuclease